MKKIIGILTVCMCFFNTCVCASSLCEMTQKAVDYFGIKLIDDISAIDKLQNRRSINNPSLISTAMSNDILIPRNGIVDENGSDYTPLINGLIQKYVNDNNCKFVTGTQVDLTRNKNIIINKNTFSVINGEMNYTDLYTCVVDKDNVALFIWKATDIKQPSIYRVKLYWLENSELIVTELYRKEYDLWLKESKNQFYSLDASQVLINDEFVMKNLDKYVYVFCDNYGDKIIVKGISD
ncbi:MAG: hypothetical protein UH854_03820 [Clostridia bacterium]|nr:hypothetical protein [Clostridia bacterium]